MNYWHRKRALVIGGSSGLGRALAEVLLDRGARVAIAARGQAALDRVIAELSAPDDEVFAVSADVTDPADVEQLATTVRERLGGVDFVAHAAGRSMRGDALATPPGQFRDLWELNFLSAVRTVQAFADDLRQSGGHFVLVGSLAGKCAPRYLGAYPASKFPLAAFAQQLRMELGPQGVHTLLVSPGPIARDDADARYSNQSSALPPAALRPGAGARLPAIEPKSLAKQILAACERRRPELVVPAKSKLLFSLAQLWPSLADRILQQKTTNE
jgi:NAD(P)-dependent dehydrogenase (short-subunit alcohol dehydrogenase family)